MLNKISGFLFSTRLMAVLFILFAVAMAAGTFIEDAYNTETARKLVYNAWWFEAIMVFFVINFFGNIKRYQLYKKGKWITLLLHLSFLFILFGAFITRYISYEGMLHIREGEANNIITSDNAYLTAWIDGEYKGNLKRKTLEKQLFLAPENNEDWFLNFFASNNFSVKDNFNKIPFTISYQKFLLNAQEKFVANENGELFLKIVESSTGTRHEHYIKEGEVKNIHNILIAFNNTTKGAININKISEAYTIQSPFDGNFMRMADKFTGNIEKDAIQPLMLRSLYSFGNMQMVFPEPAIKGNIELQGNNDYKDKATDEVLQVKIASQGQEKILNLQGKKGTQGIPQSVKLGKLDFTLSYGSKIHELPFSTKLIDFIAEKYPGTEKSYSSYKSIIEIKDIQKNKTFKDSVFMNHILDYRGYRLFQASFDADEKGTILSVNHDFWGTWITYIGYTLLYIGLLGILFFKNTRFYSIKQKLNELQKKKTLLTIVFLIMYGFAFSQHNHKQMPSQEEIEAFINKNKVDENHAKEFGKIVIQDFGGRMKPLNTFSSELLRKVSKKDSYNGLNSDQVLLSMTRYPQNWYAIPIIYLKRGNDSIRKIININKEQKYATLVSFFDKKGNYKLEPYLEKAYAAPVPNQFEKDFIDADKKVNLLYSALTGQILKVFPLPNDANNKWVSYIETSNTTGTALDSIKNILPYYLNALDKATVSKNYDLPNSLLIGLHNYQKKYGSKVIPSDKKINAEILYNKYDVFKRLFYLYMLVGLLMLIVSVLQIFSTAKILKTLNKFFTVLVIVLFSLHTLGLIARWYISGHAPWSDAYESMIYVAWATMLFGLLLSKNSKLTLASTTFVASMVLMIAHWNWMDPSIANLQPVLNSYWLMIHVAVIVASYGPFTLGFILGLVALFLMIFTNEKNKSKLKLAIDELSYINEMALTLGLVLLTIGNFLGGQWANESWGRYWGWDPKETWALISIMVYVFVIHARFVPALRGRFAYNFMSVLAYASILMTYFGVNFHLSGLHSYASGEKQNVVYYFYALLIVLFISSIAFVKYRKYYKR
mgnify:CR=1 FL=1